MGDSNHSPSNVTYCYQLSCAVLVQPTSSSFNKATVTAKEATVTVGRDSRRQIMLQLQVQGARSGQPGVTIYSLKDAVVHQQHVAKGRASIEIPTRNLILQMSNCPPRSLNVFVKSLQAKLDILKAEILETRSSAVIPRTAGPSSVFNVLSPLSTSEIRRIRKMRGVATGESPLAKGMTSKTPNRGEGRENKASTSTTPISIARDRRILAGSIGLKRMRTFAGFDDDTTQLKFAPLKAISEENLSSKHADDKNRIELTIEQKNVVKCVVQDRKNVFFTGSAGTGKSVILKRIVELLPASSTFITAATGVAACQIGGVTLHSFAGIGVADVDKDQCLQKVLNQKNMVRQWKQCAYLIIDEISMIDQNFFSKLEYVARGVRNKDAPFGGIQLIITGDFLQLPPVSKNEEPSFCFESEAWDRCIGNGRTIILEQVKRQDDCEFVKILQNIRYGKCDPLSAKMLTMTVENKFGNGVVPTRLCTHTAEAARINKFNLEKLQEVEKVFMAHDNGYIPENVETMVGKKVVLKKGCQVMLMKNLDLSKGLSNGSRGCVKGFSENGNPMVHFVANDQIIEIRRSQFSIRIPGSDGVTRTQVPLQLAWAISIHKSQGLTLDCIEMSLERTFADGQAYVALSRARSLASIRVEGFEASCVRANTKVIRFYEALSQMADDDNDDDFVRSAAKRCRN